MISQLSTELNNVHVKRLPTFIENKEIDKIILSIAVIKVYIKLGHHQYSCMLVFSILV